jgi:hypothetical protein
MAASVVDLLTNPARLAKARETFREEVAGSPYRSLLPPDQKPPVDLNADEMAKYRGGSLMRRSVRRYTRRGGSPSPTHRRPASPDVLAPAG